VSKSKRPHLRRVFNADTLDPALANVALLDPDDRNALPGLKREIKALVEPYCRHWEQRKGPGRRDMKERDALIVGPAKVFRDHSGWSSDRRRKGPDGNDLPSDAHVFGDETGKKMSRRMAHRWWNDTREKAGIPKDAHGRFTLRFHDLRHEFGSQLLEAGAPLHDVQMTLGHENIKTTSTYLNATPESQRESFGKLEAMRRRKRLRVV
jgi:integrase